MANIHGLGSAGRGGGGRDDAKAGNEEFGVGGGQAVMRPTDEILRQARQAAGDGRAAEVAADRGVAEIVLYANGFRVNDEPFRDFESAQNRAFLEELKRGEVPSELEGEVRKKFGPQVREVGVNLVDKSRERFEPPPPKFDFAASSGRSLGGGSGGAANVAGFAGASPQEVRVDESQPKATVQLVLHDRKRVRQAFNRTHTVLDVYRHIQAVSGHAGPFMLFAGFPPKQLADPSATVGDAKLHGASVEQRLPK